MQLFVSASSPRIAGLRGTLSIAPITPEQAAKLIYDNRKSYVSYVTYEETCDALAFLSGIPRFYRKKRDDGIIVETLKPGDLWLIVTVKDEARSKDRHSLGAFDFEFTLCEFAPEKGN